MQTKKVNFYNLPVNGNPLKCNQQHEDTKCANNCAKNIAQKFFCWYKLINSLLVGG